MPRKGKDQTFDELVNSACRRTESKYASSKWYKFKLDKGVVRFPSYRCNCLQPDCSCLPISTELHKFSESVERFPALAYSHDFVLDLEPYDVHECIAEGSMGTLYYVSGDIVNKTKKGKFFPIVRFGSSLVCEW
jgi:hypothetical protein